MGHKVKILHSKFNPVVHVGTENGTLRMSMLTFEVEPLRGPRWGSFRIAIHHPDGKVEEWVAHKGEWHDILGQERDTFSVWDGPDARPPAGSTLEVVEQVSA